MTWTGKWLSTAATVALAGCSSGSEIGTASDSSQAPPMSENAPPLSSSAPPLADQTPSLSPQAPQLSEELSSPDTLCAALCSAYRAAGCDVPGCVASCTDDELDAYASCSAEVIAVVQCMVTQPEFDCGGGQVLAEQDAEDVSDSLPEGCVQEVLDLARCQGTDTFDMGSGQQRDEAWEQREQTSGEACTLEGDRCAGCADRCETCFCRYESTGAAEEQCAQICANVGD